MAPRTQAVEKTAYAPLKNHIKAVSEYGYKQDEADIPALLNHASRYRYMTGNAKYSHEMLTLVFGLGTFRRGLKKVGCSSLFQARASVR